MPLEFNKNLDDLQGKLVIEEAVANGQVGFGIWNVSKNTLNFSENITEIASDTFNSLTDFIGEVVLGKDKMLVLLDVNEWKNNKQQSFNSTFRLRTKNKSIKWVLLSGKYIKDHETGDDLVYIVLFDVSGDKFQSGHDVDTNLLNHEFFIKKLGIALKHQEENEKSALIGITVSNFQAILDLHGTPIVQPLFSEISKRLTFLFGPENEIAKFSSENFVGLVHDFKSKSDLEELTEAIIKTFREQLTINNKLVRVEVNLGVTILPDDSTNVTELLLFGEYATRQSKEIGKYHTVFFNKKLGASLHETLLIRSELSSAIENKEFYLVYQPQINSLTNEVIGVEALARWKNDKLGIVSPGKFIPIAEKHGSMMKLGSYLLKECIKTARDWLDKGYPFGAISINVSPVELRNRDYINNLISLCQKYELPQSKLLLEITEGVYMEWVDNSVSVLNNLILNGFRVVVDDFGSGYSNLAFLSQAKLSTLKIDKSLVDYIDEEAGKIVMEGIINLTKSLNFNVLAEGVETKEQVELLAEMGCYWIQGYYYSKPLERDEIEKILITGYIN